MKIIIGLMISLLIISGCEQGNLEFTTNFHNMSCAVDAGMNAENVITKEKWEDGRLIIKGHIMINEGYMISGGYFDIQEEQLIVTIKKEPKYIEDGQPLLMFCVGLHDFTMEIKNLEEKDYEIVLKVIQ